MNLRWLSAILVFFVLISGCQQQIKETSSRITVSEPVIEEKEPVNMPEAMTKESKPAEIVEEKNAEENVYDGMIIVASGSTYRIKDISSSYEFRFVAERNKFRVLDRIRFKLRDSMPYDVELIYRPELIKNIPSSKALSGDEIIANGIAVILSTDYDRYTAKDEETFRRFTFNMPGATFEKGDKIKYQMNRNGYIVYAEKN